MNRSSRWTPAAAGVALAAVAWTAAASAGVTVGRGAVRVVPGVPNVLARPLQEPILAGDPFTLVLRGGLIAAPVQGVPTRTLDAWSGRFFKLWNRVVDRIASGREGSVDDRKGRHYSNRIYSIERVVGGVRRSVTVREFEFTAPRFPESFEREVVLERGTSRWEADERGAYRGQDREGLWAEVEWWEKNLD